MENTRANIRLTGIDAGRYLAIAAVVLIHTSHAITYTLFTHAAQGSQEDEFGISAGDIIAQLSRFAVPFFFLASGFFFARRLDDPVIVTIKNLAWRIMPPFLAVSAFYNILSPQRLLWFSHPAYILRWILNGGAGYHLWFLPALFLWLSLALILKRVMSWNLLLACSAAVYGAGLLLDAYQPLILPHPHQILATLGRDGPSYGLLFIVLGMWIRTQHISMGVGGALALCALGALAQLAEAYGLSVAHVMPFFRSDFLIATVPFALGAFFLALRMDCQAGIGGFLSSMGRYSFGIYMVHMFFVQLLAYLTDPEGLLERLAVAAVSLGISTLLVAGAARFPVRRVAVS